MERVSEDDSALDQPTSRSLGGLSGEMAVTFAVLKLQFLRVLWKASQAVEKLAVGLSSSSVIDEYFLSKLSRIMITAVRSLIRFLTASRSGLG